MSGPAGAGGASGGRSVALLGATGLVGAECLRRLSGNAGFARVVALTRRPLPVRPESAAVEERIVDFERPETCRPHLAVDSVICCLGTTIGKAGSRAAFRRVDHDYPLAVAAAARERGARHWLLVSSLGADPRSASFYLRVKGELEAAIERVGFDRLTVVRPSILAGERSEFRFGERLAVALSFLLPSRLRPIAAGVVAALLVSEAERLEPGRVALGSQAMKELYGARGLT